MNVIKIDEKIDHQCALNEGVDWANFWFHKALFMCFIHNERQLKTQKI